MQFRAWFRERIAELLAPAVNPRREEEAGRVRQQVWLQRVKETLAQVRAVQTRLETQATAARLQVQSFEEQARTSLGAGREGPARLALQWRAALCIQVEALDRQLLALGDEEAALTALDQQLEGRIRATAIENQIRTAQYRAAEAQVRISELRMQDAFGQPRLQGTPDDQPVADTEVRIEEMRARAAALDRLVSEGIMRDPGQAEGVSVTLPESLSRAVEQHMALLRAEVDGNT